VNACGIRQEVVVHFVIVVSVVGSFRDSDCTR